MPAWVDQASAEYVKRYPRRWRFAVREFAQGRGGSAQQVMSTEADSLLAAIPVKAHVIALDGRGTCWSTEQLAQQLAQWQANAKDAVFVIGGAEGLHDRCRDRADQLWCLSALTFPHPLVRVILAEQLYRAYSLLENHPYHRG